MLIFRLKRAEHAMNDGRLDEAFEVLSDNAVQAHRRGQELISKLVVKLIARGTEHLEASRHREALADCDRAIKLGGHNGNAVAIREQAIELDRANARRSQLRQRTIDAAKRHIQGGEIELGQLACDKLSVGSTVAELKNEAERREALISGRLQRIRRLVDDDQYDEALVALRELKSICPLHQEYLVLRTSVCQAAVLRVESAIDDGRLTAARDSMDRLYGLADSQKYIECKQTIDLCQQAASAIANNDLVHAIATLRQLRQLRADAEWIATALTAAEESVAARDRLNNTPLVLFTDNRAEIRPHAQITATPSRNGGRCVTASISSGVPNVFILQVDGAPSCYVHRNEAISFGPRSSTTQNDIEILGQGISHVKIHREDGDYFLQCDKPIVVNNRTTDSKLLSHGDRIELGPRSSLRFSVPCAASSSAVIDLTGCRTPNGGCRRLILLDNAIVLANNASSHVRSSAISEPHVLFVRDGKLLARPMKANSTVDPIVIEFERPVSMGDVNVVASAMPQ